MIGVLDIHTGKDIHTGRAHLNPVDESDRELVEREQDAAVEHVTVLVPWIDDVLAVGVGDGGAGARVGSKRASTLQCNGCNGRVRGKQAGTLQRR